MARQTPPFPFVTASAQRVKNKSKPLTEKMDKSLNSLLISVITDLIQKWLCNDTHLVAFSFLVYRPPVDLMHFELLIILGSGMGWGRAGSHGVHNQLPLNVTSCKMLHLLLFVVCNFSIPGVYVMLRKDVDFIYNYQCMRTWINEDINRRINK